MSGITYEKAIESDNAEMLKDQIVKFEEAIRAQDAYRVAAAQVLSAPAFATCS